MTAIRLAALLLVVGTGMAYAQTGSLTNQPLSKITKAPRATLLAPRVVLNAPPRAAFPFPLTNSLPPRSLALARTNTASAPLEPGVYKSAPFTCLVLVPEPQADDRCIVVPAAPVPPMPMVRPELRMVPR